MAQSIDSAVDIGHVHLKVADLDRAIGFYRDVLGFDLMQRMGDQAAFLSAGGYHHHIGLNTWESKGGSPPPPGTTGLYHVAIRYPSRAALADALRRLVDNKIPISGASDHGVSEEGEDAVLERPLAHLGQESVLLASYHASQGTWESPIFQVASSRSACKSSGRLTIATPIPSGAIGHSSRGRSR